MKRNSVLCLLFCFFVFASGLPLALAADEDTFLMVTSSGNAFGAGSELIIEDDKPGDLVLLGSLLTVNGDVKEDVIAAGATIIINGDVEGDVIAAGGTVRINGDVGGDLVTTAGEVFVSEMSRIGGDALLSGGDVTLNGVIEKNSSISAGTLRTGDAFEVRGNLKLTAENAPADLSSKVGGSLIREEKIEKAEERIGNILESSLVSFFIGLLSSLALGLVLVYLFPGFVGGLAKTIRGSALKTGLLGLVLLFLLPVAAFVLLFTLFGWSLSVLLFLFTALAFLISTVPVKLLAGEILYRKIFKREAGSLLYYLTGAIVFAIVYEVPFLGGVIRFIALLLGFGAIWLWIFGCFEARGTTKA